MFLWMSFLTGLIYPLALTLFAWLVFPHASQGDILMSKGKKVGAALIGQNFQSDRYFWGRPSASDYQPLKPGASNLGPISAVLKDEIQQRKTHLKGAPEKLPKEMLFTSGSGLDPHITREAAHFQLERVAKARGKSTEEIQKLIEANTEGSYLGFIGIPVVHVLKLNLALDDHP